MEIIARIVTRYREFERLYLQETKSDLGSMLEKALIRLYAEILTHLALAVNFFGEKSIGELHPLNFRWFPASLCCQGIRSDGA